MKSKSSKKRIVLLTIIFLVTPFVFSSCGGSPSLCKCLTSPGDLPSGCSQVFKKQYGTSDPSIEQMRSDYYKCKS